MKDLILALNDEQGVSEQMYLAIKRLVEATLGHAAASMLVKYVDATEGRFYISEDGIMSCWWEMCDAAAKG